MLKSEFFKVLIPCTLIGGVYFILFTLSFSLLASTTESALPYSIEAIVNLSPNDVTVLQENPDAIQSNWLVAVDQGLDTDLRVAFPTPSNSLEVGAGLQEFRIRVRKWDDGSGPNGTPSMDVYLYEDGTEVLQLATGVAVGHADGQVYSYTWDAGELASTSGATVELRIFGSSGGGGPNQSTLEVGAIEWNAEIEEPDLVQGQFRFYENRDNVTPTVFLAGENEPVTAVAQNEVIRLRINAYGENGAIPQNYLSSTLQYAALGGEENCSSVATSTFVSVGGVGTAEIWRGYSNVTPLDGTDLSSLLLSSSVVLGTYEEENPTALLPRKAKEGERVEWDFVIQNNGAESNETYCFRLVKDGTEEFLRYDSFAEAEVVRGLTQVRYRWRNDDGAEDTATWKEAESTPTTLPVNQNYRLRIQIDNEGNVLDTAGFRIEYATSTVGPWNTVPVDNPGCATTSEAFRICNSSFLTDGATTTRQLSEITGSIFVPGYILDSSNPSPSINFNVDEYTEMEWSIQATEGARSSEVYYFRLSDGGRTVGTYSEFPSAEVEGDNAVLAQNYYRWYEHNNQLTPTTSWGGLGENTAVTSSNNPPKEGDTLRLRMSLTVSDDLLSANSREFSLQYAEREGSCGVTTGWGDVGAIGSAEIWRGVSTAVLDGSQLNTLLLSVSDVAGTFEEENPSALNPNEVLQNNDVEYDWVLEQNGAKGDTAYCFRVVLSDGTELSGYNYYPTLTTAGFSPESATWRWYSDAENITPTQALANESVSPTNIDFDESIKLRVVVNETAGVAGENVKFRLQFSESSSFSTGGIFMDEIESCEDGESVWCYAEGGGEDNAVIAEALLSTADSCIDGVGDGCGTHNFSGTSTSSFSHTAGASTEYEFTLRHAGARANTTYFFRLVETESDEPVSLLQGESYPSLSTLGAELTFSVYGLDASISTQGVVTDVSTTPTSIPFDTLPFNQKVDAAQRKTVETNAPNGFTLYMFQTGPLMSSSGNTFESVLGTNSSPLSWNDGCTDDMDGCYGYHAGDDTLEGGSARFAPNDSYAAFEESLSEIAYSSSPVNSFSVDTVMSIQASRFQPAGDYRSGIVYLVVPSF